MSRESSERFEQSRRPHIFEAHFQQHPCSDRYGFDPIDRLVRSGKAPGFESKIHS